MLAGFSFIEGSFESVFSLPASFLCFVLQPVGPVAAGRLDRTDRTGQDRIDRLDVEKHEKR
jgi:hypothetical protein